VTDTRALRCSILRGGTSRGVFFHAADLPADRARIDPLLLDVFGSPDIRQIDGLGGATSQTSKAAIIGPPSREDADVDYTFAQVAVDKAMVDWGGNCGNISSAVGPFAIDAGYVDAVEGTTVVRVHNTNTAKIIVAHVPVRDGRAVREGDYAIPGVPGTGARIDLDFTEPAGSATSGLLPTGRPVDEIALADGRTIRVSVVDAANPTAFVLASDLGLEGTELPADLEARRDATDTLEEVRSIVAEMVGIVADHADATAKSPGLPKVGMVAPPAAYRTTTGRDVAATDMDLQGRLMSMQTAHRSYMVTGAICTAAAAYVEGTLVHQVCRPRIERPDPDRIRIANPYGVMDALVRADGAGAEPHILGVAVGRTARHILDGHVYVPARLLDEVLVTGDRRSEAVATRA
jgi:2-methylaconitate cis-trans-isomerase PrpF